MFYINTNYNTLVTDELEFAKKIAIQEAKEIAEKIYEVYVSIKDESNVIAEIFHNLQHELVMLSRDGEEFIIDDKLKFTKIS